MAIFIILMRLVDIIWLVAPVFAASRLPDPLDGRRGPAGLAGAWLFLFARHLRNHPLMPLNDPYLKEAFSHDAH